jgi:hypothetical protein
MNRTRIIPALVAALCAVCGCSSKPSAEAQPQVRLTFRSVQDPIHELCIDDTYHRTHYFTGPLVRFEHSTITLNGSPSSAEKLLDWAKERYTRSAEPTLWVQVSPDGVQLAEDAPLPLVRSLPHLQLRKVDPDFSCGERQMAK